MNSTRTTIAATNPPTMSITLELDWDKWLLACATQAAEKPRFRPVPRSEPGRPQEGAWTVRAVEEFSCKMPHEAGPYSS